MQLDISNMRSSALLMSLALPWQLWYSQCHLSLSDADKKEHSNVAWPLVLLYRLKTVATPASVH